MSINAQSMTLKADRRAWGICWLLFASTTLCYMDRQAIALVAVNIKNEFHINNEMFGWVISAFALSYALFQVPAGFLADRYDVRRTYAIAVLAWSIAAIAMGFAPTLLILMLLRAALGVGEAFNWPCALKTTERLLPPADRSLGNGIFNSGAAVGAVLTPLIVPIVAARFGWRVAFAIVGGLGFAWLVAWVASVRGETGRKIGRSPADDQAETEQDRTDRSLSHKSDPDSNFPVGDSRSRLHQHLLTYSIFLIHTIVSSLIGIACYRSGLGLYAIWIAIAVFMVDLLILAAILPRRVLAGAEWAESLGELARNRRFLTLAIVSISVNVCWHFLINWLPSYLQQDRDWRFLIDPPVRSGWALERGIATVLSALSKLIQAGGGGAASPERTIAAMLSAIPFLAADFGNLLGGAASRKTSRYVSSPAAARGIVMCISALLIFSAVFVVKVESATIVLALLAITALGAASYMANYFAFCQEVSRRHTGLVVGYLGALGNLFAAGFHPFAGKVRDQTGSFGLLFLIVGILPFIGVAALGLGWGWSSGTNESNSIECDEGRDGDRP